MYESDALRVEIDRQINGLKGMEVGSEKLSSAVNDVTKLLDRKIEMDRKDDEAYEKAETRKTEQRNRWIGYGVTIFTTVLGTIVTVSCFNKSMEFEKTGTITTLAGRLAHSKPFKK